MMVSVWVGLHHSKREAPRYYSLQPDSSVLMRDCMAFAPWLVGNLMEQMVGTGYRSSKLIVVIGWIAIGYS
jgi:hypothetical protein